MKKICGYVLMFGLVSFDLYANAQFTLNKAKAQLVNDNVKLSIAYEQYIATQADAQAKALKLLPGLSIDMLVMDYQYTILRSIIPEPHRFFEASAAKDLTQAASLNRTIVKKNLLEDFEKTFFLHQFHKEMVESSARELEIKSEIASRSQEAYDLGTISFDEYYYAQRDVVNARTQLLNATELVKTEEFAMRLMLQVKDSEEVSFNTEDFYNGKLAFPAASSEAQAVAVNSAPELASFDHLIAAAEKQKKGVALSWLSWSGVGFDYFARNSIAKSEIRKLQLQKTKASLEIKNQVSAHYAILDNHEEKMGYQEQLVDMAEEQYARALSNYNQKLGTFITLKKAEISLMSTKREMRRLQYEHELQLIKLKRLLGSNMLTNVVPKLQ